MVEYGSRCEQREGLVDKAHLLKKLIDRFHIPPYLLLSREDDDDVRDSGKHDFHSLLPHPMLSDANLIWGALIGACGTTREMFRAFRKDTYGIHTLQSLSIFFLILNHKLLSYLVAIYQVLQSQYSISISQSLLENQPKISDNSKITGKSVNRPLL